MITREESDKFAKQVDLYTQDVITGKWVNTVNKEDVLEHDDPKLLQMEEKTMYWQMNGKSIVQPFRINKHN